MQSGERMFIGRALIDCPTALMQHEAYCVALASLRFEIRRIDVDRQLPDCAFVEDCAILLPGVAVICRLGAPSRQREVEAVALELSKFGDAIHVEAPATIEGGDVLRSGNRILVGRSTRTNADGIAALRRIAEPIGLIVTEFVVHGCLHLKTACGFLPDGSLLANPNWVELPDDMRIVRVDDQEPWAGNILLANQTIVAASSQPRTNQMLRDRGFRLIEVDISEFQKAEGGVTCLSILVGAS